MLVDDSDPDTDLTKIQHLLQTSGAIRKYAHSRWFVLTGLIHDLGRVLCLLGERNGALLVIPSRWIAFTRRTSCLRSTSMRSRHEHPAPSS